MGTRYFANSGEQKYDLTCSNRLIDEAMNNNRRKVKLFLKKHDIFNKLML